MSGESNSEQHSDGKALNDDVRDTRPINRWGLWSASGSDGTPEWHELIHYWFVQYNPLYFFSAFCVLAGVSLLALEIDGSAVGGIDRDWSLAQVFLFAIIQFYELLLIAAAGFLVHKIGLMRPAVILMLLEGLFLFDCTFRLETISHLGLIGTVLSIVWVILVPIKIWLLGVALRIHIPKMVIWILAGGAAGIALMLQTLGIPDIDRSMIILTATWWGAGLFAIAVIAKPRIFHPGPSEGATEDVCRRIAKSLLILLGGVYFYHVLNYVIWVGLDDGLIISPMIGTAFLMVALLRADEREIWAGTALSLVAAFLYPPAAFAMCVLATVVLLYRARQSGKARFVVGAVLSGYLATWALTWTGGQLPPPPIWSTVVAGSLLGYLAWKLREPTAILVLVAGGLWITTRFDFNPMHLLPQSRLGLGILLVTVGFLALTVGVWVNWWFRSPSGGVDHGKDGTVAAPQR